MRNSVLLLAVCALVLSVSAPAQVPNKISYQGLLTKSNGVPVSDGGYDLKFELFNVPSGGGFVWSETKSGVSVHRGTFSVILGELAPSFGISFDQQLYVEVTALAGPGITSPITFSPRSALTSAPYALRADTANNVSSENGNLFIGRATGSSNTIGTDNVFIGDSAGNSNDLGSANTFVGSGAGRNNRTDFGRVNTFVGYDAGYSNLGGDANTFVGKDAGRGNTSGVANTFVGHLAGNRHTTGHNNTFVGENAAASIVAGVENTIVGSDASCLGGDGSKNSLFGFSAGAYNNGGNDNTCVGWVAGQFNSTGSRNTVVGSEAGRWNGTGTDNTYLGYGAGGESDLTNATAIGANAYIAVSNALVLGNNADVGIGTSAPIARLQVGMPGDGTSAVSNGWILFSSRRWKTNVKPIDNALEKVLRLEGVSFDWKESGMHDIGLVAEEVGEVFPELVTYEENGQDARSLDYARLVAVLIEAIKEQQTQLQDAHDRIRSLESALKRLNTDRGL